MLKVGDERPLSNSSMVALSRNVSEHIFTCEVQDINPAANFSWTLDGGQLPTELVSDPITGPGTGGLTTSMSNATLVADPKYNGKELKCAVVNYDGDPGIMIRVMLTVDDPCKSNPCKNGRNCTLTPDGFKCVCPLGTQEPDCDSQAPTTPESTTESSTIGSPGPSATTEPTSSPDTHNGLSIGAIVGIAIGCVVPVVVMIGILTYCCCKKQEKQKRKDDMTMRKPENL
ncbi:sushi, nidogen and EGF-like domain-containing protein 1 isoform X4 [Acanthaster planci]|uniref:Sushi, nidogen and EGF-like domain-containing protein 1 isoform X4 n=1 Tax=Acanthaster planci TaxID=133434 RepID=A0A8B8A132_ACAPL|nr:sushi, nidogen and EGF-like domain-containing protein 1 isoform X4 [Acanthaster planci]